MRMTNAGCSESHLRWREGWCRRRDLNPHGLRHTPLKRACLPFHHFGYRIRETSQVKRLSQDED